MLPVKNQEGAISCFVISEFMYYSLLRWESKNNLGGFVCVSIIEKPILYNGLVKRFISKIRIVACTNIGLFYKKN